MAQGDIVQLGTLAGSGSASSFAPTLASPATTGNLLLAYGTVTVAARTATTPSGWTAGPAHVTGGVFSSHIFWKESDGTETDVTINLSGSAGGYYNIIEIDATGLDLSALNASAEDTTNIAAAVSSQTSGTASGTASAGVAVAFFGVDLGGTVSDGRAYTNGFTERDTSDMTNTSRGGYFLATKSISGTSNETTWSNTEGSEEAWGAILVFESTVTPTLTVDSVSGGDQPGESWVFALSNDSGAGMTANIGGAALTVTAQTSGSITVTIPDLLTFDGGIHRFSENLTVQIVDGASSDTIDTPITPATGYVQFIVPDPIPGAFASSEFAAALAPQVLAIGDYIHCANPADSDAPNGIFPEGAVVPFNVMDMSDPTPAWGTAGTMTIAAADDEAPVITLTGDATINLSEGDSYTEQGATWTDNVDGSGAATVGGDTVDTNTVGSYVVTYDYTDAAGNAATQVTRTVNVTAAPDTTAPVLSSPTATVNGAYAATGTVSTDESGGTLYVLVSTNSTETASTIKASINNQPVTSTGVQNITASGLSPETTYYIHYVQVDSAGNTSNVVSSTSFTTEAATSGGFDSWDEWMASLDAGTFTTKLRTFLQGKGYSGSTSTMLYEYLKTVSSKASHQERKKDWEEGGWN